MGQVLYLLEEKIKESKKNQKAVKAKLPAATKFFNFSDVMMKNLEKEERMKKTREQSNKHVLKVYKIK